ncbi:unnamed protein product [Trifolium pratense]|uniref:Uncharacterized protein n=1 Tax=Trifolium pratense TaxID=57577 RepID=A0ACB0JAA8_TRIPR|nr:unnamed protein product [Trifolium pratense]
MTVDQLQSSLLVQEQRMKYQRDEQEQILKVSDGGGGSGGRGENSYARGRGRGRGRGARGSKFYKESVECYKCHKLDSGCSNHMVGNKDWLFEYDDTFKDSVKLEDDSKMLDEGKGMNVLVQKEMVTGLPKLKEPNEECSNCMKGKQQKQIVPKKSSWRASVKLELIHSDICGPINPESNGKKRGGEYTSNYFNEFCDLHGIKRQLTAPYTPHQNGVSERKNRTIMNMVRCMINERNVPKIFWPEAVNWSLHILNRCPTFAVKDVTPEEAWSGIKPSMTHFKKFGCIAYVHVPDNLRKKLDDKSTTCVHLGISEESKAYKLYVPIKRKIVVSKDVKFDERKQWNWENKVIEKSNANKQIIDCEDDAETCSTSGHNENANEVEDNASNASNAHTEDMDLTVLDSEE